MVAAVASVAGVFDRVEAQTQGEVVTMIVASPALRNRLGDAMERPVLVYLPPGYHVAAARYPVVYLLHAFGAPPETWLGGERSYEGMNVAAVMDSLIAAGEVPPMLLVMPDAVTGLGGSWYASSPVSGDWEQFIAGDLVRQVDQRFRTIANRSGRGIAGQSMGAYGALRIAMRHSTVFSAVAAISPLLAEDPNPLGEAGARMALAADPGALDAAPLPARVLWSRAAAFTPDPDGPPPHALFPYRLERDELRRIESLWVRWQEATLSVLAERHAQGLGRLAVLLQAGDREPIAPELRRFAVRLAVLKIGHEFIEFPGDHVRGVRAQFATTVLPFFVRAFSGARHRGG